MDVAGVYLELYGRIPPLAAQAVEGLTTDQLTHRVTPQANPIGWLVWHMARVEDTHIAELLEADQLWARGGWAERFGLAPDPDDNGYGHTPEQVASVRPESVDVLVEYVGAAHERACRYLVGLQPDDLDRIVDRRWDPPVTMGVRLVSIADDCLQHAGQAAYVRGLLG
ncbi:MAG: mycothiol transferase [Acidimicrobiia bacterium]